MDDKFDVIIVGAGSAGSVLANRLSRDPARSVLLLEAGGSDETPLVSIPASMVLLARLGWYQWGDSSQPDPELGGRRLSIPHGRILGGSSSLNFMAVVRGTADAFEQWEAKGARGWGFADVLPHFRACESWAGGESQWRGSYGEVGVVCPERTDPLQHAFADAVREMGYEVVEDYNSPHASEVFGPIQYSVGKGRRASTGQTFLKPARKRQNLTVRTGALATRVLFEGRRAVGVEYQQHGQRKTVRARDRVILSGGGINSPHLLLLSGVGPAEHLRAHGIDPIADLPVGQNLVDHIGFHIDWERSSPGPVHRALRLDRIMGSMIAAYTAGKGFASTPPAVHMGFVKSAPDKQSADLELILAGLPPAANFWFPGIKRAYQDGFGVRVWLLNQQSRGRVELVSNDPNTRPSIQYNSLTHPEDLPALREGYRKGMAIGQSCQLAPFRQALANPRQELCSDEEIDAFIRANAFQLYHPSCTCPMGDGPEAVLDSDLAVKGLEGLYVCDASAMPALPSGGPNIVSIMMADKAAAMWYASN